MEYMLLFYQPKTDFEQRGPAMSGWMSYVQAVQGAGIVKSGAGLEPPATATSVRVSGGQRRVQDGPFADAKEQLGGFFVIDVPSLDTALEWAARAPCASTGGVEVRPVMQRPPSA